VKKAEEPRAPRRRRRAATRDAIIFFLRYPERGTVKTRLAQDIGDELAYGLYLCFIRDLLGSARAVDAELIIVGTGSTGSGPPRLFSRSLRLVQHGRDLGARMHHAFVDVFRRGYDRVVLMGSDCPGIPADYIKQAFDELAAHDVVLGPARDGGYFLVGFTAGSLRKEVFEEIPWSTTRVLAATIGAIEECSLELSILPQREDIDTLEDLTRFAADPERAAAAVHTATFIEENREKIYGKI
jgi:uncharacterized protein